MIMHFRRNWELQIITYMTKEEMQKQVNPIEKWIKNVGKKFSLSRNILSEISVVTNENNRALQPEGKQLHKENEAEPCGKN